MRTVITYGTFDLFHVGHLELLRRLRALGDRLLVGVSTDEFNWEGKRKRTIIPYADRARIVGAIKYVDEVFPERGWEQKVEDVKGRAVDVFGIGDDWAGKFDFLKEHCEVVYLPRTVGVSSTALREMARFIDKDTVERLREVHSVLQSIVATF